MKKIISVILSMAIFANCFAQTPQAKLINYATQTFIIGNGSTLIKNLFVDQDISPRVLKPGPGGATENIEVMFLGHWLDITDEVTISGTGVNLRDNDGNIVKGNGRRTSNESKFPNYDGTYCIVQFTVDANASVGTHTVRLKRRGGLLGNERHFTEFYLEVTDMVRLHTLKFQKEGTNAATTFANSGDRGTVIVTGYNLNRINGIADSKFFDNPVITSKTAAELRFTTTLGSEGDAGYQDFMSNVRGETIGDLKNSQYPFKANPYLSMAATTETMPRLDIRRRPVATVAAPTSCTPLRSQLTLIVSDGSLQQPNLQVSFNNGAFTTIANGIVPATLCPADLAAGAERTITVPNLRVLVTNTGNAASNNTNLFICTVTNSNINAIPPVNIPPIGTGSQPFEVPVTRNINTIRIRKNVNGTCTRIVNAANPFWTDAGVMASIYTQRINGLMADNAQVQ